MPKGLYELSAGFDSNNLVNLQIDTFERMNKFQEDLNIPDYKPISIPESEDPNKVNYTYIPKDIDPDTIIKGNYDLPSLKDGLLSSDPKIRQIAKNIVEKRALSNPVTYGVGTDQYVPYTEGQNKFTNKNIFKGKKQTMFGYDPYVSMAENEDFYNKNVWNSYTNLGKLWRGTATFTGRVLSKAVTGIVGMAGDLSSMVWNGLEEMIDPNGNNFWEDVSNNWLSRKMEQADEHVKNQWLPTYKSIDYDNKGAWSKLFDPYTWTNSYADGIGFLLQFAAPGMFLGKLGQAGRLARSIGALQEAGKVEEAVALAAKYGTTIQDIKKVSNFTKFMGYDITNKFGAGTAEFLTGSNNVGGMTAHIFNTGMEALAETKENFNNTVRELVSNGMSKEEAVKIAGENAPGQFWVNTAILSVSNAFENKFFQKAIGNRRLVGGIDDITPSTLPENFIPKSKVGKFFESNKWGNRINFYGKNYAKASFFEGFWEENAQTAAARWARGEYQREGDDGGAKEKASKSFVNQLWKQTKDAIKGNDREAADSIMAGAVIGVLGNTVFSKLAGTRSEIFSPEVKDVDGNIIQQKTLLKSKTFLPEGQRKAEIRQKAEKVSNFINTRDAWLSLNMSDPKLYNNDGSINKEVLDRKTEEIKVKLAKINSFIATTITSDDLLDANKKENYKQRVFADYVKAHILNETGDALVSRLKEWKTKSPDELEIYGVSEEIAEDSKRWAETAENLVNTYKKIKDIRYAAPADTRLTEYQNNVSAIHSVIYDYTALKSLNDNLSAKYEQSINENNPFSEYPLIQDYNQDHIKLLKLKQKLEKEDLDVIDRENIQKQIDDLEKKNKERKETIGSLGETIQSTEGLLFPKNSNKQKESEKIANYQEFFENLNNKIDLDIESEKYGQLIKEYSNESTGYQKYLDLVAYWDKINNEKADKEVAADTAVEVKNTIDTLKTEIEDLESQIEDAKTKEEKDAISKNIQDKKDELKKLEEDSLDLTDTIDETIPDEIEVPLEQQYGADEYLDQALAYITPFKTVNKETIDAKDENGERIKWKEIALKHGYDHDLSVFARFIQNELVKYPDKYEAFVIKDTLDFMKQRLSDKQLESFDEGLFKVGAIVVFREKGKNDFLTFKNKKLIAFSYNEKAFNYNFDERVKINAERTKRSTEEVIKFFNQEQAILEAIREKVVQDNIQVPVKISLGSLGVLPNTFPGPAFERFNDFVDKNNPITIVKPENVNEIAGALNGQVYLNIPESKTVNNKKHYIGVYTSTLTKGEQDSLQEKIYSSVQAIQLSTFKTKKEASDIIKNYLFNFFYISENNNFKIKEVQNGFKIVYVDKKGEHLNWLNIPRLKVSDKLYNTEEGFSLYEKKDNSFQPTNKISKEQYREFIHNHLLTKRKVVIQSVKDSGNKLFTDPVNAYLNLSSINSIDVQAGDATETTEQVVLQSTDQQNTNIETQIIDIERRRQEELFGNITALEFETTDTKGRLRKTTIKTKVDENGFKYSFETTVDGKSSSTSAPKVSKDQIKNSSIYENLDQNSKDFIDELPDDAVIFLQSIAISNDKNSAAGLGNGNITIGYASKSEGGRVDDIALKYQPNKINAKYDAELKALEQTKAETQANTDNIEAKKADIERRRQEELNNIGQKAVQRRLQDLKEASNEKQIAQAIINIEKNVKAGGKITKEEQDFVNKKRQELKDKGFEIVDLTNQVWNIGMKLEVLNFKTLEEGTNLTQEEIEILEKELENRNKKREKLKQKGLSEQEIDNQLEDTIGIMTTVQPQLNKDGKMVQSAKVDALQIEVSQAEEILERSKKNPKDKKQERENKINAKYDAEYVDAVKKGEMTKEQAMQALEEVGRKNSAAYAELAALEQQPTSAQTDIEVQKADILQKKKERLANVKPVYHHTNVDTKDFNFNNFQRGNKQVSQFGDGLNASSNTTSFLVSRYGKPIQGEVNDADFVKIDASKTEKEVYEELKKQGYIFSEVHDTNDVLSEVPGAAMELFTDFQKSNPNVKGVRVSNHIIGNTKVAPFYVIYDAKSFYGQGALSKKIEQESNAELASLESKTTTSSGKVVQTLSDIETQKADIERRKQENDTLGKSILQKLGYKNENRLPNGNVKGGQAGWKIRFNIKNPKTGESYYDGKGTTTLLNDDYNKRAETLINFLLNYFGSNEKADSKNLQKHYVLEDKDGTRREPFKHLSGGEIGESDFTIYIGSADDVMKFISDIRTKHPEILELLHAGNKSEDVLIDDIFKGRIEGSKIGFSGYHAPTNLNKVTGSNDFTFNFNQDRVNINYNGSSLSGITIIVESSNKGYKGVFDENLKKDFPELYKNIRNIVGFQLYGDYLQGSNDEFLKLTGVDKINAKYDAELAALKQSKAGSGNVLLDIEQKAIDAIKARKTEFKKLIPFTNVILDDNSSIRDKKDALKAISDQMLASSTAEIVGKELGKTIGKLIDDLGYPAPIENEALKEISKIAKAEEISQSTEDQLVSLKQKLAEAEQNKMTLVIKVLTKKVEELENQLKLEKKPEEKLSPLDKLRLIANNSENSGVQIAAIVPHIFEGSSFKINFDNNTIDGYFEDIDENYTLDFFKSFDLPVFTKRTANINNIRYYFVKHNKLGKFVVFDENLRLYSVSELPKEVLKDPMFKYIENCD